MVSSELEGTRAAVVCEQARRGELEARCAQLEVGRESGMLHTYCSMKVQWPLSASLHRQHLCLIPA